MIENLKGYKIHHMGYVVRNLGDTVQHFKDFFGIDNFQIYDFSPTRAWSYGKEIYDYNLRIAMGMMPDGEACIEIIQPLEGEGVHRDFINAGNNGLHHICFTINEGYDHIRTHFDNLGAKFVFESETEDEQIGYRRCFYAEDPETNMVFEIKEAPYFRKVK